MSDHYIFLSDVHYGAFDKSTNQNIESDLIRLIDYCTEHRINLYILGDLFDYWMEYPNWRPDFGNDIIHAFQKYFAAIGPVLYITGNHDNWTTGFFSDVGFDVEGEYRIIRADDYLVFLHHGDGLKNLKLKLKRPWLHRVLRNKIFVRLYQFFLNPRRGIRLMKWFSGYSRARPEHNPKRLNDWSKEYLSKNDVDFVISGHDHIPRIETFPDGTYINCGSFCNHRTIVEYTNGKFQLVIWSGMNKEISAYTN